MPQEIETKFKIKDLQGFKTKLESIGAKFIEQRFESDMYYAPKTSGLFNGTVRVRSFGDNGEFTIKYNPGGSDSKFKVRQELQVKINDPVMLSNMLKVIGYKERFKKEKKRRLYSYEGAVISIDILPYIGAYVEIEAPKDAIEIIAGKLGLNIDKAIPDTYMDLFVLYKTLHNLKDLELVFPENER